MTFDEFKQKVAISFGSEWTFEECTSGYIAQKSEVEIAYSYRYAKSGSGWRMYHFNSTGICWIGEGATLESAADQMASRVDRSIRNLMKVQSIISYIAFDS